jgi:hypothetical protein
MVATDGKLVAVILSVFDCVVYGYTDPCSLPDESFFSLWVSHCRSFLQVPLWWFIILIKIIFVCKYRDFWIMTNFTWDNATAFPRQFCGWTILCRAGILIDIMRQINFVIIIVYNSGCSRILPIIYKYKYINNIRNADLWMWQSNTGRRPEDRRRLPYASTFYWGVTNLKVLSQFTLPVEREEELKTPFYATYPFFRHTRWSWLR